MKIRIGFVSNSSSSSFVIERDAYPNVFSLARHMLSIRNSEGNWGDLETSKIIKAEAKHLNSDQAVQFSTCNYDTYIIPRITQYLVSTCNNHDWEPLNGVADYGGGHDDGDYIDQESKTKFWFIKEGLLATPIAPDELDVLIMSGKLTTRWCNERGGHFDHYCKLDSGTIVCPGCWHRDNPKKDMFLDTKTKLVKPCYIKKGVRLR